MCCIVSPLVFLIAVLRKFGKIFFFFFFCSFFPTTTTPFYSFFKRYFQFFLVPRE